MAQRTGTPALGGSTPTTPVRAAHRRDRPSPGKHDTNGIPRGPSSDSAQDNMFTPERLAELLSARLLPGVRNAPLPLTVASLR